MKIAFIVGPFPTLSETFILNQITGLIDRGHTVDIFSRWKGNESKVHPDVKEYELMNRTYYRPKLPHNKILRVMKAIRLLITNFHKNPGGIVKSLNIMRFGKRALFLSLFYDILPFLDKKSYDIIHCHFGPYGNLGVLLRELGVIKGKIITAFHGYDMAILKNRGENIYNFLFEKGDLFLPISERWKRELLEFGCDEQKVIVHRMGVDTSKFNFSKREKRDTIRLLTVARLIEKKGVEFGIRAVAKVLKRYSAIEYKIAGDGELRNKIEELIEDLKIGEKVRLLGWQQLNEIKELMQEADILLAPSVTSVSSEQEGIPVVLMEALATGLPVISTQHSGIPELVQDGKSGFLAHERDVDALAERLEYLIEHPEIWPEMGRAGREQVEENYDIDKLNEQLVEIYQKLLEGEEIVGLL